MTDVADEAEASISIKKRWMTRWVDDLSAPLTTTAFENQKFVEPTNEAWANFQVIFTSGKQTSMGQASDRRFTARGMIRIEINNVPDSGGTSPLQLASVAAAIFKGAVFDGIACYECTIQPAFKAGAWYVIPVEVLFWFDTIQ